MNLTLPMDNSLSFKLQDLSRSERVIYWTIVLTPLWWLLGIQTLFYPTVLVWLLIQNFSVSKITRLSIPLCVWSWLGMSVVMLWTGILGLDAIGFNSSSIAAAFITLYKSYLVIFAALLVPFLTPLRTQIITRATAWMVVGAIVTLGIQIIMLFLRIGGSGFLSPLARFVPGNKLAFKVGFAVFQPFFGIPFPRTALYTPDPPILGAFAFLCFFICLGESNQRLRQCSLVGCLMMLIISQSRIAWVTFPIALLLMACIRQGWVQQWTLWLGTMVAMVCSYFRLTVKDLFMQPMELFTSARPESSSDRALVVGKTLEAWQQKPWLGWGTIQGSVKWYKYDIALGSFSTYPAVLYLHGVVGLAVFVFAQITTLGSFWNGAMRGNAFALRAFASLLSFYMLCNATPLTWMTVNIWFYFLWLGAVLAETKSEKLSASSWEY
jgi:hypothetical protein